VALATPALALNANKWRSIAKALKSNQTVKELAVTPSGGTTAQPLGPRVPATGVAAPPLCGVIGGTFQCLSVVSLSCSSNALGHFDIQMAQEGSNAILNCDTTCQPSTPDDEGYCDCEIDYGSCTPA